MEVFSCCYGIKSHMMSEFNCWEKTSQPTQFPLSLFLRVPCSFWRRLCWSSLSFVAAVLVFEGSLLLFQLFPWLCSLCSIHYTHFGGGPFFLAAAAAVVFPPSVTFSCVPRLERRRSNGTSETRKKPINLLVLWQLQLCWRITTEKRDAAPL